MVLFEPAPAMTGTRPAGDLDAELDDAPMLGMAQRRAFAGRADRHEAVRPLGDLPLDEIAEGLLVDLCRRASASPAR